MCLLRISQPKDTTSLTHHTFSGKPPSQQRHQLLLGIRFIAPDNPAMVHSRVELAVGWSLLLCKDGLELLAQVLTNLWVLYAGKHTSELTAQNITSSFHANHLSDLTHDRGTPAWWLSKPSTPTAWMVHHIARAISAQVMLLSTAATSCSI